MTQTNNNTKSQNGIDPKYIRNVEGKEFILYNGLLDFAHQLGLKSIEVDILQFPTNENGNTVICKATAKDADGRIFSEIADANAGNVDAKMVQCFIRCASTRSKSRCLRDLTNTPMVCFEELGNDVTVLPETDSKTESNKSQSKPSTTNHSSKPEPIQLPQQNQSQSQPVGNNQSTETVSKISVSQRLAIENLSFRKKKLNMDELNKLSMDTYGCNVEELTSLNAANMIRLLQKSA